MFNLNFGRNFEVLLAPWPWARRAEPDLKVTHLPRATSSSLTTLTESVTTSNLNTTGMIVPIVIQV